MLHGCVHVIFGLGLHPSYGFQQRKSLKSFQFVKTLLTNPQELERPRPIFKPKFIHVHNNFHYPPIVGITYNLFKYTSAVITC
jgi:hypothetical protein